MKANNLKKLTEIKSKISQMKSSVKRQFGFSDPKANFITMDLSRLEQDLQTIIKDESAKS